VAPPPLVSIVTPVRNGLPWLPELLASVRAQDHPRIEHVVVDGGSTDGTLELLRAEHSVVWVSGPDRGMYDAIGKGLRLARGEILAYQNADDRYVVPAAVSTAVRALAERPEVGVVFGDYRLIDAQGRVTGLCRASARPFRPGRLRRTSCVPPHSAFVRRSVLEAGHWPDPSLRFCGDWDWFLGMAEAGVHFAAIPEALSEFRVHGRSLTQTLGLRPILAEWRRVCRRRRVSFAALVWTELVWNGVRRRLGLP
jgi:glycosyltransferase involved in cell wall biosynthesis